MIWRSVVASVLILAAGNGIRPIQADDNANPLGPPAWAALEAAAQTEGDGRHAAFVAVADDSKAPPQVRALALIGAARSAADPALQKTLWQRLADAAELPEPYRAEARRELTGLQSGEPDAAKRFTSEHRVALPTLPEPALVLHVAPDGNDQAAGSATAPLASLTGARDALRKWRASSGDTLPLGGARVVVHGGQYTARDTWRLEKADSGTASAPIVYEAAAGESPVLTGGVRLSAWHAVTDAKVLDRLAPEVKTRVQQADLAALGVSDYGDATDLRRAPELFVDGTAQTLAEWPNTGFVATGDILGADTFKVWNSIDGCKDGKFRFVEDQPKAWIDEPDVRLYGYWFWDWYEEFQKVASIDAEARTFTLDTPYSQYGYRKGQRYRAVNVLRELDKPGEWYLDREQGRVYWLPAESDSLTDSVITLSVLDRPFIALDDVEHVVLRGLKLEDGRSDGIQVRGGSDCVVAGCTLRQFGGDGIVMQRGVRHTVFGCTLHTLGCAGIRVAGGDRVTLVPGEHVVENCMVSDVARRKRTYSPSVHVDGCGQRVAHNRFELNPSSALRVEGNDHVIELNSIQYVVEESDDQGGIDMFGNPLYRGVVIRWNHWSDITGGTHCGAAGVRLDDMISGVSVYGNIFQRCGAALFGAVQIHGGKENIVDNNLFLNCFAGVSFSSWGRDRWLESIARFRSNAAKEPLASRYPDLARLDEDPDVNWITRNVFISCGSLLLRDGGKQRTALNVVIPEWVDPRFMPGFMPPNGKIELIPLAWIPWDDMGQYKHPWKAPSIDDAARAQ
jgi:hypothetical protein